MIDEVKNFNMSSNLIEAVRHDAYLLTSPFNTGRVEEKKLVQFLWLYNCFFFMEIHLKQTSQSAGR